MYRLQVLIDCKGGAFTGVFARTDDQNIEIRRLRWDGCQESEHPYQQTGEEGAHGSLE